MIVFDGVQYAMMERVLVPIHVIAEISLQAALDDEERLDGPLSDSTLESLGILEG